MHIQIVELLPLHQSLSRAMRNYRANMFSFPVFTCVGVSLVPSLIPPLLADYIGIDCVSLNNVLIFWWVFRREWRHMGSICHLHLEDKLTIVQNIYQKQKTYIKKCPLFLELLLCMSECLFSCHLDFEQNVQLLALYYTKQRFILMVLSNW